MMCGPTDQHAQTVSVSSLRGWKAFVSRVDTITLTVGTTNEESILTSKINKNFCDVISSVYSLAKTKQGKRVRR